MFLAYIHGVRIKEGILLDEIDKLNPQINRITDEVAEIFSEMKKFEIVKENRELEAEAELQRKSQLEIDEMAIMNFVRKTDVEYYN
jgi:flagellar export protein FliJ